MTSWKARMLDELFLATDAALGGAPSDNARWSRAVSGVLAAIDAIPAADEDERSERRAFVAGYLDSMPERYLLSNAPAAIAAHAELARRHALLGRLVSVALIPSSRYGAAAQIGVIAADRPGLLAAITAAIAASRLEVHAAQIHTRTLSPESAEPRVEAVDLFWVRDRGEDVDGVARALPKLERELHAVLAGDVDPTELAKKRAQGAARPPHKVPRVRTQVSIDNRATPRYTIIEVLTRDRPFLLFTIADALYRLGLSIAVAKINTEGARVADVFYVSERDGSKIAPGKRSSEVEQRLLEAVEGTEQEGSGG
jgi:[protein-PII] uridylyltransferase